MRKQLILNVTFLLLFAVDISAQSADKTVESINKRYAEIAEKARLCEANDEQGEFGELFLNTLTINSRNHQWRAVGTYGQTFKFFYQAVENDEKRLYPDQLVFVKVERKESNRRYLEEYLYSDRGSLVFYRKKAENDERPPGELTVYFLGSRPVKITVDGATKIRFSESELKYVSEARRNAARIRSLFDSSNGL